MDTSLKLQLDVRNNAQDLQNYMLDLNNWEEEMKKKESALNNEAPPQTTIPPPRNKIKRSKPGSEKDSDKPKKISAYDYSAWDKFDVEKACAQVDDNEEKEKTDQEEVVIPEASTSKDEDKDSNGEKKNLSLIDEAFYEKEMGNSYVKKEQWADAIKCYTKAITLDSSNPIYYANRSLCFLKLQNFKAAETDATTAIQLDKNYVKAYQRRAFARQALGQLAEAKADFEEVLRLEPKNALSRVQINKIDEILAKEQKMIKPAEKKTFNPKNMFKSDDSKVTQMPSTSKDSHPAPKTISKAKTVTTMPSTSKSDSKSKTEDKAGVSNKSSVALKECSIEKGGDGDKVVPSQSSKPADEIFKPLPEWCKLVHPVNIPPHKRSKKPLKKLDIKFVDTDEDLIFTEVKSEDSSEVYVKEEEAVTVNKPIIEEEKEEDMKQLPLEVPKTAIQFQNSWKILKNRPQEAYNYLKKIPGNQLPQIFENSLESDFVSELVTFLASDDVQKETDVVYNFLLGLSAVKRFSSLTLFMSEADRKCVKKSLNELEKVKSKEEISQLRKLYEL